MSRPQLLQANAIAGFNFDRNSKCRSFSQFILNGQRFVCVNNLTGGRKAKDHSASFARLRDGTFVRVDKGLEIMTTVEHTSIYFLAVVPYKVVQKGILAAKPTILNNTTASQMPQKWVQIKDISSAVMTILKPIADTANFDKGLRIALPSLQF